MNMNTALHAELSFSSLPSDGPILHNYQTLIQLFNSTFSQTENTVLVKGGSEPIYIPASNAESHHQIIFAHDYFASALHEISHWCIAGKQRRLLEDYGYCYSPDGRNMKQQAEFEKVEVKPQAIEWAFSCATSKLFTVSADNLHGSETDTQYFQRAVKRQVLTYLDNGFPPRASQFIQVLQRFYQTANLHPEMFDVE